MVNLFLSLLFCLVPAWATCSKLIDTAGADTWHCPDTGVVLTNGDHLKTFLTAGSWACGDTIILYAGVEYRRPNTDLGTDWVLKYQTGCNGKVTQIISSRLAEIPFNQKKNLINYIDRMPLMTTSNSSIWAMSGTTAGSNNYAFRGIAHSTTERVGQNRGRVSNLFLDAQFDFFCSGSVVGTAACQAKTSTIHGYRPRNFEIDRCIFTQYERIYGEPVAANTDGNAFMGSVSTAVYAPFAGLSVHDSYVSLTGFTNTTAESGTTAWLSVAAATNANPAVLTDTGWVTALGITYSASCTTATDNFATASAMNDACIGHWKRVVIRGATGNWATLNGAKYLRARSDGSVDVLVPNADRGTYINMSYFDSTSLGALSGTIEAAAVVLLAQYAVSFGIAEDIWVEDNFLEAWAMPLWAGGVDGPQYDQATIQSSSTDAALILDHVRDLKVGMLVTFNVPVGSGRSDYCHLGAGDGCYSTDKIRTGRVTAINGTTVSLEPWGPDGIDGTAPDIGQVAWWKNVGVYGISVRGNHVSRGYLHLSAEAGKGAMEFKHCERCLIDGNVMGGYLDSSNVPRTNVGGTYFLEPKSQGGTDPNTVVNHVRISNNLGSGQTPSGNVSCMWRQSMPGNDQEHSMALAHNMFYEHNVHVGCVAPVGTNYSHPEVYGTQRSGHHHNTYAVGMAQTAAYSFVRNFGCNNYADPFYPEYTRTDYVAIRDNIIGYGEGAYLGAPNAATCWPTYASDIQKNIIVDTESIGTSTINAAFPGNFPVADYTTFWAGTCDYINWLTGCKLHASNPNRGAGSDGGDPGADLEQVKDRLERWSERAGLIDLSMRGLPGMVLRSANWSIGSAKVAIRFQLFASSPNACTIRLYTDRDRETEHADTTGGVACNRTGSVVDGNVVSFVWGTASALTASTTYFYKITDGVRVMVGEFTTAAVGSGQTWQWSRAMECGTDGATFGTAVAANTNFAMSSGDVRYCRESSPTGRTQILVAP